VSDLLSFPLCRRCGAGDLVPFSDDNYGATLVYNAWTCNNPACAFTIRIRRGQIFFTHATVLSADAPPEPEPSSPGSTWRVWQRQQ
jgi:hypothetical protein